MLFICGTCVNTDHSRPGQPRAWPPRQASRGRPPRLDRPPQAPPLLLLNSFSLPNPPEKPFKTRFPDCHAPKITLSLRTRCLPVCTLPRQWVHSPSSAHPRAWESDPQGLPAPAGSPHPGWTSAEGSGSRQAHGFYPTDPAGEPAATTPHLPLESSFTATLFHQEKTPTTLTGALGKPKGRQFNSWSGHRLGVWVGSQSGCVQEATHRCFSLPLFLPPFPSR